MGNDIADFNNDALPDIIAVDMNPEDNYRKKKNLNENNYYYYQSMTQGDIMLQYVRNTLQLHQGMMTDTSGLSLPVFSDISYYAGVAETDWSWSSLFADFDNDGFKDLFITNGYPKDVTDHDFAFFKSNYSNRVSKSILSDSIPKIRIPNYAYRNRGTELGFENVGPLWGLGQASFSAGAAFADLDNDGDADYVVSNINDKAFVYENRSEKFSKNNFVDIIFRGEAMNRDGLGAVVTVYDNQGRIQFAENSPYRGYLSSMNVGLHFGLGAIQLVDSIVVQWPGGKQQTLVGPAINQTLLADISQATFAPGRKELTPAIFRDVTTERDVHLRHSEADYIDFDVQRLLPHKLSEYGPGLAVADVDGNGLDDLFVGSSKGYEGVFLLQQHSGQFIQKELPPVQRRDARKPEVLGVLFFDADADGDPDLYTASGSNESVEGSKDYQDRLFKNDGKGNFTIDTAALPINVASKSCVKAADIDLDGDLDLFVGGRLVPSNYPRPASSFIFRNDSGDGVIRFTDVTRELAPGLHGLGLVCDATWSDFDNDGWPDLVIAGEWMPILFFKNNKGKFQGMATALDQHSGWWTSISAGDFDNDGDIDYVAGNVGENSYYRGDSAYPARIYSIEIGGSSKGIAIPSLYLPDGIGEKREFPAHVRDDVISQWPVLKKKFLTYHAFAKADMDVLFSRELLSRSYQLSATYFKSAYIENKGSGIFVIHHLPAMAQMAPINGIVVEDLNGDGYLDLVASGNDYGAEVSSGRYDAMNGLVMLGDGNNSFRAMSLNQSGFFVPGNARALVKLKGRGDELLLAASQNRSWLKLFEKANSPGKIIRLLDNDRYIYYKLRDGRVRKEELYYGNSFLSQSSRIVCIGKAIQSVEVVNHLGQRRVLQ